MATKPRYAWLDGGIVPWEQCVLHVRAPGAFWGANVFEGVRGYLSTDGHELSLFRLTEHLARLRRSMKFLRMTVRFSDAEIQDACRELIQANGIAEDAHLTIAGYFDLGDDLDPMNHTACTGMHITAVAAPRDPTRHDGISVGVSSWRRISDDTMPPRIKTGANYHNSRLAHHEAVRHGYDTALFLNVHGHVAESPGSCLVMVSDGRLITPPGTSGTLEGITLASVAELARRELDIELGRREVDRTELYFADEVFLCGTLHEIMPVTAVDGLPIGDGSPGSISRRLQTLYEEVIRGHPGYRAWRTGVKVGSS